MSIAIKDKITLWAKAAGQCSFPGCGLDLIPILDEAGTTIIGEMAHVIGRKPGSARSDASAGPDDSYDNLILLCPTHHTLVDKSSEDFPEVLIRKWKVDWEEKVASNFSSIESRADLFRELHLRLEANKRIHSEWGPVSERAIKNPLSRQAAEYWSIRKAAVILPNNETISRLIKQYSHLLKGSEFTIATELLEHIDFYRRHCEKPADSTAYMPFPSAFAEIVEKGTSSGQCS